MFFHVFSKKAIIKSCMWWLRGANNSMCVTTATMNKKRASDPLLIDVHSSLVIISNNWRRNNVFVCTALWQHCTAITQSWLFYV